jgi:predicted Rossmann fold nucleotide-binding protein DprA/Smf involved in DNA uptake
MIDFETLSPDAPAIILLCSSLGEPSGGIGAKPLGPVAYTRLADALRRQGFAGPRDLVRLDAAAMARSLGIDAEVADAFVRRLGRAGQLGFELDRLRSRGVWVVTVADDAYPVALRARLGPGAPPVLFATGSAELLAGGGVAIVGSRDADAAAVAFTERLASAAARGGAAVVSGGARGIDVTAMRAAFEAGGAVIGVVPEGVERRLREASTRSAVGDGRAVLVSPYHPMAAFSAGAAMGRNKLIYALAEVAVVVSSAEGSGGTWAGAIEALEGGWVPVLVRDGVGAGVGPGNAALIARGASPLDEAALPSEVDAAWLREHAVARAHVAAPAPGHGQQGMFD